jgi:hypothetical protein
MELDNGNEVRVGYYSSLFLVAFTLVTFGFAMMAVPSTGPYCPGDCMEYPYLDCLKYYPRDYYWMYLAVFQTVAYLVFMVSIHFIAPVEKKMNSFIGVCFSLFASIVLGADYFIQFSVVPISLMKGETEGIALISQYNGHGVFIALEELGYLMMSLSFLFMTSVFSKALRLERTIHWIFMLPFPLIILSFIFCTLKYGVDRNYRFEVAAITINWLALIIVGILVGMFFYRQMRKNNKQVQKNEIKKKKELP